MGYYQFVRDSLYFSNSTYFPSSFMKSHEDCIFAFDGSTTMCLRLSVMLISSGICLFGIAKSVTADVIGFNFVGTVTFRNAFPPPGESPWNISIKNQSPLSGRFLYDTQSAITINYAGACDGTCAGYRQQIENGFYATFEVSPTGSVRIQANDYLVGIFNNLAADPEPQDTFFVSFDSALSPPLSHPLVVGGADKSTGLFNISLVGSSNLFPDVSLPSNLNLSAFDDNYLTTAGILNDYSSQFADVLFSITSLQKITPIPGDYNFDLQVNQNDYQRWKSLYNSTLDLTADGNNDRIVNAADYTVWRNNLPPAIGAQVPELTSACLSVIALGVLSPFVRRCRINGF